MCQARRPPTPPPEISAIELLVEELRARQALRTPSLWRLFKIWVFALYYLTLMRFIQPQKFELAQHIHQILLQQYRAQSRQQ